MRISPINNNYNFKGSSKTSNLGRKVNASIVAAMLVTAAIGYYKNKEVWDEFIKEQRQERVDNLNDINALFQQLLGNLSEEDLDKLLSIKS